ncbi:hypothetical protein E4U11_001068 [Claviceps purpurea]|nr:hypothetical protein E4U11_001068 [Claviceps purpurea]
MADESPLSSAAPPGRVTRSSAQTAATTAATASGSATQGATSQDEVEYLTKDMLPAHMSRFAGYITENWEDSRNDIPENSTSIEIDNKIAYLYSFYVEQAKTFERLRRTFCEDFEYWTLQMWEKASSRTRQEMRDLLQDNGIDVGKASGRNMIASELHRVVTQSIHGDGQHLHGKESQKPKKEPRFNDRGDLVTDDGNSHLDVDTSQPLQDQIKRQQTELADVTAKLEAAQRDNTGPAFSNIGNLHMDAQSSEISTWMPNNMDAQ